MMPEYLKPIDEIWQPSDFLPDASKDDFFERVKDLQQSASELSYDLVAVLIGDTITEEALPTYESWLAMVDGVSRDEEGGWMKWNRHWTSEENRHGDLLNKYLYLSGRVDMRQMEISTQYLIADGFDIGTGHDPYRNFIYTSFQELATNVSHRRVASLAKKDGDTLLSKMCGVIASDEARHAKAYKDFIKQIFAVDANEAMLAYDNLELNNRPMNEVPHPFVSETMKLFEKENASTKAKIHFIHFNHTNPIMWQPQAKQKLVNQGFNLAEQSKSYQ